VGQGKGEGFTVNIPLGKGHRGRDFAGIIYYMLNPLALAYHPDIILVSCGFDLYMHDPLGGMHVTPEGYALITFFLLDIAQKVCNGRIAFVMEGGYSLTGIRECGLRVMQELCDVPTLNRKQIEKVTGNSARKLSAVRKVIEIQKEYWKILR
jgi:acetoin utilization deacetylase AcuC-like enzyme